MKKKLEKAMDESTKILDLYRGRDYEKFEKRRIKLMDDMISFVRVLYITETITASTQSKFNSLIYHWAENEIF